MAQPNKKILIIDDDKHLLRIFSMVLQKEGYEVLTSLYGKEALGLCIQYKPALILLDIVLPDILGFEVLKELKDDMRTFHVFVVLMSAKKDQSEHKVNGYKLGADGYFIKPINNDELLAIVDSYMRHIHTLEKLQGSESRFRRLFEHNIFGLLLVDVNRKILLVNKAAKKLFAEGKDELVGLDFKYPYLSGTTSEISVNNKERRNTIVEIQAINIEWEDAVAFLIVAQDITEQKRIYNKLNKVYLRSEERLNLLNEVEKITHIGGWEMEIPSGKAKWTKGTYDIVEIDYNQPAPGLHEHSSFYLPEYKAMVDEAINKLIVHNINLNFKARFKTAKGNLKWCHAKARAIRKDGKCIKIFGTFQDITKQKQTENELDNYRIDLEKMVEERTNDLQIAEQELLDSLATEKKTNELLSHFISMVTHQFKTPLTTIHSSIELLEFKLSLIHEEKIKQNFDTHLKRILTETIRLDSLLNDILILRKINDKGLQLHFSPHDLIGLTGNIIKEYFIDIYPDRKPILKVKGKPVEIRVDKQLFKEIIINLLSNAFKYSTGCPKVVCEFTKNKFIFRVIDNGIGIPENDQEKIFEPFFRSKNVHTSKGTGLGLSIAKQLIELHNGQISFSSEINRGTEFIIHLPYM